MKRAALLALALGLAGIGMTTATASTSAKRAVCHRTSSAKTPYVKISVTAAQLKAHLKHAADISPVPAGGCPKSLLTAASGGRAFAVALTGEAETPAGGPRATRAPPLPPRGGAGRGRYPGSATQPPAPPTPPHPPRAPGASRNR